MYNLDRVKTFNTDIICLAFRKIPVQAQTGADKVSNRLLHIISTESSIKTEDLKKSYTNHA